MVDMLDSRYPAWLALPIDLSPCDLPMYPRSRVGDLFVVFKVRGCDMVSKC